MTPTPNEINSTLDAIEQSERTRHWQSDAERLGLPVVNIQHSGAPLLRADDVLGHEHHKQRLGRK